MIVSELIKQCDYEYHKVIQALGVGTNRKTKKSIIDRIIKTQKDFDDGLIQKQTIKDVEERLFFLIEKKGYQNLTEEEKKEVSTLEKKYITYGIV